VEPSYPPRPSACWLRSTRKATPTSALAVVIAQDLPFDRATVLAELIHKQTRRAIAVAYDRGFAGRGES
jgi:hypothetical protein